MISKTWRPVTHDAIDAPLKWREPLRIIVNVDLFEWFRHELIAAIYGVMAACIWHKFEITTKHPDRYADFLRWIYNEGAITDGSAGGDCGEYAVRYMGSAPLELLVGSLNLPWPLPNVEVRTQDDGEQG